MAEEEAKLKTKKARSAANPIKAGKTGGKPNRKAKKTRADESDLEKVYYALDVSGPDDENVDGIEKLRVSVNRVIAKRSVEIAKRLAQKAEEGNLSSAKLIMDLGSKKQQAPKRSTTALLDALSTLERDGLAIDDSNSDAN